MTARLAVVILQYGNWRETVACLQSLVPAVQSKLVRVIVVDNASPDASVTHVEAWIGGVHATTQRPEHDAVASHWWPLAGCPDASWLCLAPGDVGNVTDWTMVTASANRGFAAGMNVGIALALQDPAIEAIWLLNNDTVVDPAAAQAVHAALDTADHDTGQFGTTVCYYDRPNIVQSIGWCRWNPWLATAQRLHDGDGISAPLLREVRQPGYVYGASWVLRTDALRDIGLLSEEGFLYGEELDWSCRASKRWKSGVIGAAIVWHHEGATIGARASTPTARSELADLCGISARIRVSRRFFSRHLPSVYLSLFGAALNRLRQGKPRRAAAVARLVLDRGLPAPWPATACASPPSTPP